MLFLPQKHRSRHGRPRCTACQTCGSVTDPNADLKGLNIECRDAGLIRQGVRRFSVPGRLEKRTSTSPAPSPPAGWWWKKDWVTGAIQVENIWIQGSLEGTLTADETVTIHRHAKFLGDITARRLIIEEGGAPGLLYPAYVT